MTDASEFVNLTVDDVVKIIGDVRATGTDPITTVIGIFNNLGNSVTVWVPL